VEVRFGWTATEPLETSVYAQYLYDSRGQRVMKFVRDQSGGYETTVYVDGLFEQHEALLPVRQSRTIPCTSWTTKVASASFASATRCLGMERLTRRSNITSAITLVPAMSSTTAALGSNREEFGETSFSTFARKRYRFTGKERDVENGLYYHGARYYASWLARWISPDPLGMSDGLDQYEYVKSNPMCFVDATGDQSSGTVYNQRVD
jgi:RHS repeat-associated protein